MKNFINLSPPRGSTWQAILLGALLAVSAGAQAQTASGVDVNNQATLSYTVGGVLQTDILSDGDTGTAGIQVTTFKVDKKVDVAVVTSDTDPGVSVVPGQNSGTAAIGDPVLKFTVTNEGNDTQDIALTVNNAAAGSLTDVFTTNTTVVSDFQSTSCTIYLDDGDGIFEPGADDGIAITSLDNLASDATATVFVRCATPLTATNGQQAVVGLEATVLTTAGTALPANDSDGNGATVIDVVYADATGPDDGILDAAHSERSAYNVVSASLSVAKTVTTVCDPTNGNTSPYNIPGAYVQYAITIANSGSSAATLTSVTDSLVSTLAWDPKLISGAGGAAACASTGTSLSATGFGVVTGSNPGPGVTAPGLAADAVTAGATVVGQNVTITFSTLAKTAGVVLTDGSLPAGNYITVYFNAIIQ